MNQPWRRIVPRGVPVFALLLSACAAVEQAPPAAPAAVAAAPAVPAPAAAPSAPLPKAAAASTASAPAAPQGARPAPAKPPPKAASPPPGPATQARAPAPAKPAAPPALDLKTLENRLKETTAIGVFTKLTLKNQIDELLDRFRAFHQGRLKTTLAELRRAYDLLLLKTVALLQDADPPLAGAILSSRESIWGVLSNPAKFAAV